MQTAAGRIYFEMPDTKTQRTWAGYVCSGTVVPDSRTGQSVILTAAHCVYDDVNKAFARNVLFIPNQAATPAPAPTPTAPTTRSAAGRRPSASSTPTGPRARSRTTSRGTTPTTSCPTGPTAAPGPADSLESAAGTLTADFTAPDVDLAGTADRTTALGYSYSDDPDFMYCAEDMTTEGTDNWWLPNCGLSGGASGGPWVQPLARRPAPARSSR